jgi:hypothetical protein
MKSTTVSPVTGMIRACRFFMPLMRFLKKGIRINPLWRRKLRRGWMGFAGKGKP